MIINSNKMVTKLKTKLGKFGMICFGLFNGISIFYGLLNVKILVICKWLITIISIYIFNVQLQSFFIHTFFYYNVHSYVVSTISTQYK